jgi:transcriptional regulator with XRE-family HTH domain
MATIEHRKLPELTQDVSEWTAETNLHAQEALFEAICTEQADSGRTINDVAERLGISTAEVEDALRGRTDLTLTELRLLSIACDVVVTYSVRPSASAHSMWLRRFDKRAVDRHIEWEPTSPRIAVHWNRAVT